MNSFRRLLLLPIITVIFFTGVSCTPITITPDTHPNIVPLGKLSFVQVQDVKNRREGDKLQAHVSLLNSNRKSETIYYRFKWLDSDGLAIGDEPVWKTETFFGEQSKVINGSTTNSAAIDFTLELASGKAKSLRN